VLSYRRFTIFLLLHTHTHTHTRARERAHTHTHTHTHTHAHTHTSCTSVFKSRANAAFLSLQGLRFDLCPVSVRSMMVKEAFREFFFVRVPWFSLLMLHTDLILIWHATCAKYKRACPWNLQESSAVSDSAEYSSNWEIRTAGLKGWSGLPGNPDYRGVAQ
jgi:ABC-type nickel/cobalt efflux system permease component RcnA